MDDRLIDLLKYFELRARVFQAGPLCRSNRFDAERGVGYIHLLRRGAIRLEATGHDARRLDEPAMVFHVAPVGHRIIPLDGAVDLVCASFEFGPNQENPLLDAFSGMVVLPLEALPSLAGALELLFAEAGHELCGRQAVLDRLIEVVIVMTLRELMNRRHFEAGLLAGLADPGLARAMTAMHAEPGRRWTLEALAARAGMSRARFAAGFREVVGTTPARYLTRWRVAVAQTLLRGGKPLPVIADAVGYANASALSRAFTSVVGEAPAQWRRQSAVSRRAPM